MCMCVCPGDFVLGVSYSLGMPDDLNAGTY